MSMDLTRIERTGYTIIDILSDVGGLMGILFSGITILLEIINYDHLNYFLISKLFKVPSPHRDEHKPQNAPPSPNVTD